MKNQMIEKACKAVLIFCRQNRSTILSCISAAGVVATGILSARGGIKAEKILAETKSHDETFYYDNEPVNIPVSYSKWKKVVRLVPALLPPVLTAAGTITLIFLNDAQNREAQAALAGAYAMMAKKLADFKEAAATVVGPEAVKDTEDFLAKEAFMEQANDILAEERADGAKLWYDSFSERYFWATDAEVSDAEYYANRIFSFQGYLMLNDFYRLIHLDEIPEGDELGWEQYIGETQYGYKWIDFTHQEHKGDDRTSPYTELVIPFGPHPFFDELAEMEAEYNRICGRIRKEPGDEN